MAKVSLRMCTNYQPKRNVKKKKKHGKLIIKHINSHPRSTITKLVFLNIFFSFSLKRFHAEYLSKQ